MEYITVQLTDQICEEIRRGSFDLFDKVSLIQAVAKDYVRETQIRLILKPIADRLTNLINDKDIEGWASQTLRGSPSKARLFSGYVAGNVLNLLRHLTINLSGYDLSHQHIWQAWLQGDSLNNINFAFSNFKKSVFNKVLASTLSVAISPNGEYLATGDTDNEVHLWKVLDGEQVLTLKGHSDWVRSVVFSKNGQFLASGGRDKTVRLWHLQTGRCMHIFQDHGAVVLAVTISPNDSLLAVCGYSHAVKLYDINTGKCIRVLEGHTNSVTSITFSSNGQTLASGSNDQSIKLWDVHTGRCLTTLQAHTHVQAIALSPNNQILASGNSEQTIQLWNLRNCL